ncbi:secretin N-terminal domain-containing protein [candidate division KSB1 bacterium]
MKTGNTYRILFMFLILFFTGSAHSQVNNVNSILVNEIDDVTSVIINSDQKLDYWTETYITEGTDDIVKRFVITINNARKGLAEPVISESVGPVKSIRCSQWLDQPPKTRIVADLLTDTTPRVETFDNQLFLVFSNYTVPKPQGPVVIDRPRSRDEAGPAQSTPEKVGTDYFTLPAGTIGQVAETFMLMYDMNIILSKNVTREDQIDVFLTDYPGTPESLFKTILIANDYRYVNRDGLLLVTGKDTQIEGELEFRIFKLEYLDANDLLPQIQALVPEGQPGSGFVQAHSRRPMGSSSLLIPSGGAGGGGSSGGGQMSSPLQGYDDLSADTEIGAGEERSNVIIAYEKPQTLAMIEQLVTLLDKPVPQVHIAVKIVETTLGENEKFGINWSPIMEAVGAGGQATGSQQQQGAGGGQAANEAEGTVIPGIQMEANNFRYMTLSFNQFKGVIEMLESREDSKLLNQPSVTTLDNQMANIAVGKVIPIEITQVGFGGSQGGGGGGASGGGGSQGGQAAVTTIQQQPINIALSVLPQVNEQKYITLYVRPVVEELAGFTGSSGQLPITSMRTATTQVRVEDGQVIILGGLIKEDQIQVETRVKFLHKLPLLGRFFKHNRNETSRSELVIFIAPSIVKDNALLQSKLIGQK